MTALPSLDSPYSPRIQRRRSQKRRPAQHRWIATEITVKLAVNALLSAAAISTLVKLLPYQLSQQEKLREVRTEVLETERRVNQLRNHFSRNFDPSQTQRVMKEQTPRIDPNQRRIFLLN